MPIIKILWTPQYYAIEYAIFHSPISSFMVRMLHGQNVTWGTYIGFIFAAVGSTIGIEDIWRFPYVVGGHQGGTFLIPYITILCTFSLFLMMLELAIGRYFKTSVVNSLASIRSKFRYAGIGIVSVTIGSSTAP